MNHEVRYSILSGDPKGNFSIDATTGALAPAAPLDFEAIDQDGDIRFFNLTVRVRPRPRGCFGHFLFDLIMQPLRTLLGIAVIVFVTVTINAIIVLIIIIIIISLSSNNAIIIVIK